MTGASALALVALAAAGVELAAWRGLGRRIPIGDEVEYLARARSADAFSPEPFLRVPLMPALARLAGSEPRLRAFLALLSVATVTVTAGAAFLAGGAAGAVTCGLLLAILPDRVLLSQHVWPDVVLAFWQAALLLLLSWTTWVEPTPFWLWGLIVAGASLTRIDGVVLLPALSLHPALRSADSLGRALLNLWGPTVLALAAWSLRNSRRYGVPWPDTTIWFNVAVLEREQRNVGRPLPTEHLVRSAYGDWSGADHQRRASQSRAAVLRIVRRPGVWWSRFLLRSYQMLGADTFGIEKLLHPGNGAYPALGPLSRRLFSRILVVSFPLLAALAVASAALGPPALRAVFAPAIAVFVAACLVHARTRYRYALLPYLSYAASWALWAAERSWATWAAAALLSVVTLSAPRKAERPDPYGHA